MMERDDGRRKSEKKVLNRKGRKGENELATFGRLRGGLFSRKGAKIAKVRSSVVGMKIATSPFDHAMTQDLRQRWKNRKELKSAEKVINAHKKQVLTYLKLTGMRLGHLLNFGEAMMKRGITRTVSGLPE